ncbi:MAG: hypothetical protein QF569_23580 [Candidatus Poribacteria bacterium]|jgi:hypothetical protein|nr:hypothetical protein [Candidatus Poribacteria bacterium]
MSKSVATVTRKGRNISAKSNATKASARDLGKLVVMFRNDKKTPAKAVNAMNRVAADILSVTAMTVEERQAAMTAAAEQAKVDAIAAIDRHLARGLTLAAIKRGTTGKGGIHQQDVVVEIFGSGSKRTAVENNSQALRSAGMIS